MLALETVRSHGRRHCLCNLHSRFLPLECNQSVQILATTWHHVLPPLEVRLHKCLHFHPGQCARLFFSIFRGSGSETRGRLCWRLEGACGLDTLTSKNARSYLPPQNPFAAMSNLAPSSFMDVAPWSVSPSSGFNAHIIAYLRHPAAYRISNLIVLDRRETSFWARECMLHRKRGTTGTVGWAVGG